MRWCCVPSKIHKTEDKEFSKVYVKNSKADSFESMLKISKLYKCDQQTNLKLLECIYDKIVKDQIFHNCSVSYINPENLSNDTPIKVVDNIIFNKYEYKIMTMIRIENLNAEQFSRYCAIIKQCLESIVKFEKKDIDDIVNKIITYRNLKL